MMLDFSSVEFLLSLILGAVIGMVLSLYINSKWVKKRRKDNDNWKKRYR